MREEFFNLPKEKQLRIINAGFEVFGKNEYKRAVTDDIAAKAGISKGLLFYYFGNKKALYMYLYNYLSDVITESVMDDNVVKITDFFELIEYAIKKKIDVLEKNPYIMDFALRAFYSDKEEVAEELSNDLVEKTSNLLEIYFSNINFSKFKEDANPSKILQMLFWLTDGYMHEKRRIGKEIDINKIVEEFNCWTKMLKKISYKEEYLNGHN
ncbi:MAG: TetR/AcrR family transcriptional regulator [Clostridium sp.]|uniref:TetR/AcrR family transcriptional regulator n=1 Tax=Clostridium sp. TaxID=1506 RepID=UPI00290CB487|nr:TetR/AcrR family transcriptional regulator [Clostridium sp.]MDU5739335.1 TetR/AcrR family transcriptional regulator [Clostridium sp.]MDU5785861.1 TetR/AcrR family transcriptional regulator [Clostridium sp.]